MANIREAKLSHTIGESTVNFELYLEMQYEEWERNMDWRVVLKFRESDDYSADDIVGDNKVHRNTGYIFNISSTSSAYYGQILRVRIPKEDVDTEPGREEIYAHIDVIPDTLPKTPLKASGKTNIIKVSV